MKVLSLLYTTSIILSTIGITVGKKETGDYVYGKDPKKDAEYDISMGMAGVQQAAKDPKLLAQLMQDMQVSCLGRHRRSICEHMHANINGHDMRISAQKHTLI